MSCLTTADLDALITLFMITKDKMIMCHLKGRTLLQTHNISLRRILTVLVPHPIPTFFTPSSSTKVAWSVALKLL